MQLVAKERDRKTERKRTFINQISKGIQIHIKSIERRYKPRVAIVSDTSCLAWHASWEERFKRLKEKEKRGYDLKERFRRKKLISL